MNSITNKWFDDVDLDHIEHVERATETKSRSRVNPTRGEVVFCSAIIIQSLWNSRSAQDIKRVWDRLDKS